MSTNLLPFLKVPVIISLIGMCGLTFLNRTIIHVFLAFEIIFLGNTLMFIFISEIFGHARGQGYALILLAAAAAESAVGLALVVYRFHVTTSIYLDDLNMLKG